MLEYKHGCNYYTRTLSQCLTPFKGWVFIQTKVPFCSFIFSTQMHSLAYFCHPGFYHPSWIYLRRHLFWMACPLFWNKFQRPRAQFCGAGPDSHGGGRRWLPQKDRLVVRSHSLLMHACKVPLTTVLSPLESKIYGFQCQWLYSICDWLLACLQLYCSALTVRGLTTWLMLYHLSPFFCRMREHRHVGSLAKFVPDVIPWFSCSGLSTWIWSLRQAILMLPAVSLSVLSPSASAHARCAFESAL